jgi:hypothetical protein
MSGNLLAQPPLASPLPPYCLQPCTKLRCAPSETPGIISSRASSCQAGMERSPGVSGAFWIKLILASRAIKRKRETGKRSRRVAERLSGFRDYEKTR